MSPRAFKAGAAALALLAGSSITTEAFAIRNRYTQEQSSELGVAIMQALGARDAEGRPARYRRYPSEYYGQAPAEVPLDVQLFDNDR